MSQTPKQMFKTVTQSKEINMTEEEVRAIVTTMEQEKLYPCFTELRKRVIEGLPRLLGRLCPEIIGMIPHVPASPDLEGVAGRLINGGSIWGTDNYSPITGSNQRTHRWNFSLIQTSEPELGNLRANVLEALPVLMGWLKAHEVMALIPISPLNSQSTLKFSLPTLKSEAIPGWICGNLLNPELNF